MSALATHQVQVYHEALHYIFTSCENAAQAGVYFRKHGNRETGIPIAAILSMDYEEQLAYFLNILL